MSQVLLARGLVPVVWLAMGQLGGVGWTAGSGSDTGIGTGSEHRSDDPASSLCSPGWMSARSSLRSFAIFTL